MRNIPYRRIIAFLLALFLIPLPSMTGTALAASSVLSVSNATAQPGETVVLTVSVPTGTKLAYFNTTVSYDSSALTLNSITGAYFTDWTVNGATAMGLTSTGNNVTCGADLLTLNFTVKASASARDTTVSLKTVEAYDENENAVSFTLQTGKVTIGAATESTVTISEATAKPGEAVTLTVSVPTGTKLAYFNTTVSYDSSVLTLNSITGAYFTDWTVNGATAMGLTSTGNNVTCGSDMLTLNFTVKSSASAGSSTVTLQVVEAYDENENAVSFALRAGKVTVVQSTHTHTIVTDPAVPATCSTAGKTKGSHCSVCNAVLEEQTVIPALGHTVVTDAAVSADCTTAGMTEGSHCSVCNEVLEEQTVVPALGHTVVTDAAVPADCTTAGMTEGSHCSVCDEVLEEQAVIPALGHAFEDGTCSRCGAVGQTVTVVVPELLLSGKSITLKAELDGATTNSVLVWTIVDGEDYATVSAAGVLKAKVVTEEQIVTVRVSTADGEAKAAEIAVKIVPVAKSLTILQGTTDVSKKTVAYNLRDAEAEALTFSAKVLPYDAGQSITWTCSDKKGTYCNWTDNGDGTVTVTPSGTGKTGTITLTATANDGSKRKTTVKVKFAKAALVGELEILNIPTEPIQGKQTIALKASLATLAGLTDRGISWSLSSGDSAYASITSAGKLTVKEVGKETIITVTAAATANPSVRASVCITLSPVGKESTAEVRILKDGKVVNNGALVLDTGADELFRLSAEAYPAGAGIVWKSSSEKIATVDETGLVTGIKAGTVTITATADDGSKVYASVKVTVQANVKELHISNTVLAVTAGKSLKMTAAFEPVNPTNSKVTWSLRAEDAPYATISTSGVLKAAKVTGIHAVQVTATSKANTDKQDTVTVYIYPAATAVNVRLNGEIVTGKKVNFSLASGTQLELSAYTNPYLAKNDVTWKSSSAKLATVDANGSVTFTGVTGTVKITATAADGSGRKAVVSIIITK